jgi:hypothetical protein
MASLAIAGSGSRAIIESGSYKRGGPLSMNLHQPIMTLATSHPLPSINNPERFREVRTHPSALGLPRGQLQTDTGARSYER